jgi:hypothetical protein
VNIAIFAGPLGRFRRHQGDLHIGADHSWNRGAVSLINSGLLDNC